MGLDLTIYKSETTYRVGSYSHFNALRNKLCEIIHNEPYNGSGEFHSDGGYDGDFKFLLNHSDCDGLMYSCQCEETVEDWNKWKDRIQELTDEYEFESFVRLFDFLSQCDNDSIVAFG